MYYTQYDILETTEYTQSGNVRFTGTHSIMIGKSAQPDQEGEEIKKKAWTIE
jgi:hypothetical protein